ERRMCRWRPRWGQGCSWCSLVALADLSQIPLDPHDTFHSLEPHKQALQLIQSVYLQCRVDQGDFFTGADLGGDGGHIDADLGDNGGDIANEARAIVGGDDDGSQVALLAHAGPSDVDEAFAFTLAIATDVFAVGAVNDGALAATDEADN